MTEQPELALFGESRPLYPFHHGRLTARGFIYLGPTAPLTEVNEDYRTDLYIDSNGTEIRAAHGNDSPDWFGWDAAAFYSRHILQHNPSLREALARARARGLLP